MKLVIDLQPAQSASRHSGIGRNALAMAEAMVRGAGEHEVVLALSNAFPDTIEPLRATFDSLLPQEQIVVWEAPTPMAENDPRNDWRHKAGEILREAFLSSLKPDVVYVPSLIQGYDDDTVVSIGARTKTPMTALALHDVAPLHEQDISPATKAWFEKKVSYVLRATLWFSPSEAWRQQCISRFSLPPERVVNVSIAAPKYFRPMQLTENQETFLRQQYGVTRQFLVYDASTVSHDGLNKFLHAYARLEETVRRTYQVLLTGADRNDVTQRLGQQIEQLGLAPDEIIFAASVRSNDLGALYNLASAFCLPGLNSGFGMAGLEAMQCGTATIGANLPGISEIIGRADALFDPKNDDDIAGRLHRVLADETYRRSLSEHGLKQAQKFTWDECAGRAWDALEAIYDRAKAEEVGTGPNGSSAAPKRLRLAYVAPPLPERDGEGDQSVELLRELFRHYEIDVISDRSEIADSWIGANCPIRSFPWFSKNAARYNRVLYNVGDPKLYPLLKHLLHWHPGIVVLHDFPRDMTSESQNSGETSSDPLERALYYARGYHALSDDARDRMATRSERPIDVSVLQNATVVIFSNSEVRDKARHYFGEEFASKWVAVPGMRGSGNGDYSVSPRDLADQYFATIESFTQNSFEAFRAQVVTELAAVSPEYDNESDWLSAARAIARNLAPRSAARQLLVDISELVQRDIGTGIQRVTRSLLKELLSNPPKGYRVEPVYALPNKAGYCYARNFTLRFLDLPTGLLNNAPVETRPGDIFLGLDLQRDVVAAQQEFYAAFRRRGGRVYFVIYDLLPILLPHAFPEGTFDQHTQWLSILARRADALICISRSVADEVFEWLNGHGPQTRLRPLQIGWFHLGADIEMSVPTRGIPDGGEEILTSLAACPSFLAVGTIEPRKGYAQILKAFDQLWTEGVDVNLTIVGRQGWNVDEIAEAIRGHREFGKRLMWLEGISDEYLEKVYAASACLIFASEGEGFGLPLIEAARSRISILARDIPVFREVAGENISYFGGSEPSDLARAVKEWLVLYGEGRHPRSDKMPWLTWAESADCLKELLLQTNWYKIWPTDQKAGAISGYTSETEEIPL